LTIKGKNFKSIPDNTRIDFQGSNCCSYNYTVVNDSVIQMKVPNCVTVLKCRLGLLNNYFTSYSSSQLSITSPVLQSFENNQFCIGEYVNLVGKMINSTETKWYVDGKYINLTVFYDDSTHVRFYFPEIVDAGSHKLRVKVGQLESNEIDFSIKKLVIKSTAEDMVCRSGRLTIYGENFARFINQNVVKIDGVVSNVIQRTDTYIKVQLPYYNIFNTNPTIVVKVGSQEVAVPNHVNFIEPWEDIATFDAVYSFGARFTVGNKFYFSTGSLGNGEFYCFEAEDKSLKRIADYPGGRVISPVCFVIGQKAYVGLGYQDSLQKFWSYDPASDSWSEIADYPLTVDASDWSNGYSKYYAFVYGQTGFVGYSDGTVYKYNPGTNQWNLCVGSRGYDFSAKNASFCIGNSCWRLE
jgi:hypothetical protein